jgi:DNA (cytosine-5)-methyltransferase 1
MEGGEQFKIILEALSELDYFIEWRIINPLQFGIPQNRDRVFIFGVKKSYSNESFSTVLEKNSVFLIQEDLEKINFGLNRGFSDSLTNIEKSGTINNWGIAFKGQLITQTLDQLPNFKKPKKLFEILEDDPAQEFDFTKDTLSRLNKSSKVHTFIHGVEVLFNQAGGARMGYTVFGTNGVAPTLTASTSRHYERYKIGNKYRRLTNIEYARLMGFPDNWCDCTIPYNQYSLYGNALVPVCVEWIVKRIGLKNIDFGLVKNVQLQMALNG